MSVYTILLFIHVGGEIGLFLGLGIQFLGIAALRKAKNAEQARIVADLIAFANPIGVISAILTIGTGLYMARTSWSLQTGWIIVALASIILFLTPIIGLIIEPRMRAIVSITRKAQDGKLHDSFYIKINDPVLGTSLQTMAAMLIGIVFLMTNKPSLVGAMITIGIAMVTGLASGLLLWRRGDGRMRKRSDEML